MDTKATQDDRIINDMYIRLFPQTGNYGTDQMTVLDSLEIIMRRTCKF